MASAAFTHKILTCAQWKQCFCHKHLATCKQRWPLWFNSSTTRTIRRPLRRFESACNIAASLWRSFWQHEQARDNCACERWSLWLFDRTIVGARKWRSIRRRIGREHISASSWPGTFWRSFWGCCLETFDFAIVGTSDYSGGFTSDIFQRHIYTTTCRSAVFVWKHQHTAEPASRDTFALRLNDTTSSATADHIAVRRHYEPSTKDRHARRFDVRWRSDGAEYTGGQHRAG